MRKIILALVAIVAVSGANAGGGGDSSNCKIGKELALQEMPLFVYSKDGKTKINVGFAKLTSVQIECEFAMNERLLAKVQLVDRIDEHDLDISNSFLRFSASSYYKFGGVKLLSEIEEFNLASGGRTELQAFGSTPKILATVDRDNMLLWQNSGLQFDDVVASNRKDAPREYLPLACSVESFGVNLTIKKSDTNSLQKDLFIHSDRPIAAIDRPIFCK